ncbi:hypothetical protein OWM54_01170 [Myxococcus sp. MISCRS1]|uniref:hypothetical protein n=1 Tax=Myxococcus sp. MISCRS1 TaxID=2996786 RepID=UPI0022707B29|nr:hypothetical protein [Myxococcus sp. MISCRS1]MCY0995739.1 hypothetical protein [Myxococcus sp. MISCRS1]
MLAQTFRAFVVLSALMLAPAARAAPVYICSMDTSIWETLQLCIDACYAEEWVSDPSHPSGGYVRQVRWGCSEQQPNPPGSGPWSGPWHEGQCTYDETCPGANSCLCGNTGGEESD